MLHKSLKSLLKVLFLTAIVTPLVSQPAHAEGMNIYDDTLTADWKNYNWGVKPSFNATNYVYSGTKSIEINYTGGGQGFGLYHYNFDTSPYSSLTFWINGGAVSNRKLRLYALMNGQTLPAVNVNDYINGGAVVAGQWRQVTIPLTALGVDKKSNVTDFVLQEASGKPQPAFYLDDISLVDASSPSIYDDAFNIAWKPYNWNCKSNPNATSYVYNGNKSNEVSCLPAGGWQGYGLYHLRFDTSPYNSLSFWINGGAVSNRTMKVYATVGDDMLPAVDLNNYITGGAVVAGQWKQVTIPLTALGVDKNSNATGFVLMEKVNGSESPYYLDNISLIEPPPPSVVSLNVNTTNVTRIVDSRMFGINTGNWDKKLNTPENIALLANTPIKFLRYPGGSNSDEFHWQTNTIKTATRSWTVGTGFDTFANVAKSIGAQACITVNYGSGTAQEAADWVAYANKTKGYGFKYWEVGNEVYGDWEYDTHSLPHDPYTYAQEFKSYYLAMKAVDPSIKIGVPIFPGEDAFRNKYDRSATNPRTGTVNYGWTPVLLSTLKSAGITPDFFSYHRYDQETGSESDASLLQASGTWKTDIVNLRQLAKDYLGEAGEGVEMIVTEHSSNGDNISKQSTSLVGGLHYADTLAAALSTDANISGLLFWTLRNDITTTGNLSSSLYGWRQYGDFGIIMSTTNELYPTYYALKLMKDFAAGGDSVVAASSNYHLLSTYAAKRQDGSLSVLVINKSPTNSFKANLAVSGFTPAANYKVLSYGIPQDEAARTGKGSRDIAQTSFSNGSNSLPYTFPPYSMTVLQFNPKP